MLPNGEILNSAEWYFSKITKTFFETYRPSLLDEICCLNFTVYTVLWNNLKTIFCIFTWLHAVFMKDSWIRGQKGTFGSKLPNQ